MVADVANQPFRVGRRQAGPPGEPQGVAYLYVAPSLLVFALFFLTPLLHAVWLSLYEWDGLSVGRWVGLDNYRLVVTDEALREPFLHALILVVFFSLIPSALGLVLASMITRSAIRGVNFFRTVLFLPQVVALVVVAVAWRQIFAPEGPFNDALRAVGLDHIARGWLGDEGFALICIGFVGIWVCTGLCVVLFLAGLSKVPRELYEAARLDGAGPIREFVTISVPAVRGELAVALTLTLVAAMRTFDLVYVMTSGGPGASSRVPAYEVWDRAINKGQVGVGVTIALILTAFILLCTVLINRLSESADA
jgi:raffinose/stachyose/melibiose transport system permease protein